MKTEVEPFPKAPDTVQADLLRKDSLFLKDLAQEQNKWYEENKGSSGGGFEDMHKLIMEDAAGGSSGQQSGHGSSSIKGRNRITMIQNSAYDILMKSAGSEHLKQLGGGSFRFPDAYSAASNKSQKSSMVDGNNNHEYQNVQEKDKIEGEEQLELDI